jgi:SCY1-like protein 1
LKESANSFPQEFATYRVLPSLVSVLEHGGASASASAILPLLLLLGKNVSEDEYPTAVMGPVVSLFASPDRGVRMSLLETMDDYKHKLDKKMVVEKIWPHLVITKSFLFDTFVLNCVF